MPLYEYECEACGHRFEVIQKFSDPPVEKCPRCGGAVHKMQSAPAFQFKGTGWYVTDYAKKSGSGGGSDSGRKGETKSEKKDEAKAADKPAESSSSPAKTDTPSSTPKAS
jgi:putative FmdB family regulatory protein